MPARTSVVQSTKVFLYVVASLELLHSYFSRGALSKHLDDNQILNKSRSLKATVVVTIR